MAFIAVTWPLTGLRMPSDPVIASVALMIGIVTGARIGTGQPKTVIFEAPYGSVYGRPPEGVERGVGVSTIVAPAESFSTNETEPAANCGDDVSGVRETAYCAATSGRNGATSEA